MCFRESCKSDTDCCMRYNLCDKSAKVCVDCWYGSTCTSEQDCCQRFPYCQRVWKKHQTTGRDYVSNGKCVNKLPWPLSEEPRPPGSWWEVMSVLTQRLLRDVVARRLNWRLMVVVIFQYNSLDCCRLSCSSINSLTGESEFIFLNPAGLGLIDRKMTEKEGSLTDKRAFFWIFWCAECLLHRDTNYQ